MEGAAAYHPNILQQSPHRRRTFPFPITSEHPDSIPGCASKVVKLLYEMLVELQVSDLVPTHQKGYFKLLGSFEAMARHFPPFVSRAERLGAFAAHLERDPKSLVPKFLVVSTPDAFGLIIPLWTLRRHDRPAQAGLWAEDLPQEIRSVLEADRFVLVGSDVEKDFSELCGTERNRIVVRAVVRKVLASSKNCWNNEREADGVEDSPCYLGALQTGRWFEPVQGDRETVDIILRFPPADRTWPGWKTKRALLGGH